VMIWWKNVLEWAKVLSWNTCAPCSLNAMYVYIIVQLGKAMVHVSLLLLNDINMLNKCFLVAHIM